MASNIKIKQGGGYAIEPGTLEFILKPDTNGSTLPSDTEVPIINTDTITSVAPGRYYIFWRNALPDAFGQKSWSTNQMDWVWIRSTSPPDVVVHISWTVAQGPQGIQGIPGLSTYQLAVQAGYSGTQSQWLADQEASRLDASNSKDVASAKADQASASAIISTTGATTSTAKALAASISEANAHTSEVNAAASLAAMNNSALFIGSWDANVNNPGLGNSGWPASGRYYIVSVAGTQNITGSSISFLVGDWVVSNGSGWFRIPFDTSNLDVKYNIWDTIIATSTGQNSNGGVYNATANTLTVPVGQTGIGTYLKKDLALTSYPQYKTGHRLTFSVIVTESLSGLATPSISFNMNKTTTGGSVNNVGSNISSVRINSTKVRYSLDYTITSIDTILSPFVQIKSGGGTASGADWVFTCVSISAIDKDLEVEINSHTDKFNSHTSLITTNSADIAALKIAGKVYDSLTVTSVPTTANGGVISGDKITIPIGSTGYTTALQKNMLLTSRTDWAVGSTISFAIIINEYSDNASNGLIAFNLHKKSGSVYDYNKGVNNVTTRLDSRTVRLSLDYTIESGVTELDVYLQVSNQVAVSGADVVFEWKAFWCLSSTKIVTVNPATDLLSQINTLVAGKDSAIADKLLYFTVIPTGYSGQALNGAVLSGARLTVPTGQSGNTAYVSYVLPTTAFINIADMVGNSIVLIYKVATSTNLTTIRTVTSGLNVVRSGSTVTGQGTNKTITVLSSNICLVSVTYTVQAGDTQLTPFIQLPTAAGIASSDQYVELQDFYYTMSAPIGFPTSNEYVFSKIVGKISADLATVTSQVGSIASVTITKTVKPDGTGDYLSPKLAMDAITDSSVTKRYEIIVYPGTYTETEWTVKPYCSIIGTNRASCWLKGEMADSSTDAQISNTSTVWLKKTGYLANLTITARNMRYAVHDEDSGNNPDAIHNTFNCHIEHYGNKGAIDWRTANPGSGLNPANVWGSARPYGYGSGSGEKSTFDNSTFVSNIEAWYVHNNLDFSKQNINNLINCKVIRKTFGRVINVQSLGSGQADIVEVTGTQISPGYIQHDDSPWISQSAINQVANHAEIRLAFSGSSAIGYLDNTRGRALRITSNSTSTVSTVVVSGTALNIIFGTQYITRDGGGGIKGSVIGYWDISGILVGLSSNIAVNNTLGKRLGDCSTVNKTLVVSVDGGSNLTITFNKDYTSMTNASILTEINSVLGSAAVADEYNPALDYYPLQIDKEVTLINDSITGINKFSSVAYNNSYFAVRNTLSTDSATAFIGMALENIPPGKSGRILREGIMRYSQMQGLTGLSSGTIVYGSQISLHASSVGSFEISPAKQIGKGMATDWIYFKSNS